MFKYSNNINSNFCFCLLHTNSNIEEGALKLTLINLWGNWGVRGYYTISPLSYNS